MDCIFCRIVKKEIPAKVVLEDEDIISFEDIHPSADIHILIVPKIHIKNFKELEEKHKDILLKVYVTATKLVGQFNLENDFYRVVVNGGKAQEIPHLHFHFLGGNWKKIV